MGNIIWFLFGIVGICFIVWYVWVLCMNHYLVRKFGTGFIGGFYIDTVYEKVRNKYSKNGVLEFIRFVIFPYGIIQRTIAIVKTANEYQKEVQ